MELKHSHSKSMGQVWKTFTALRIRKPLNPVAVLRCGWLRGATCLAKGECCWKWSTRWVAWKEMMGERWKVTWFFSLVRGLPFHHLSFNPKKMEKSLKSPSVTSSWQSLGLILSCNAWCLWFPPSFKQQQKNSNVTWDSKGEFQRVTFQ